MAEAPDPHPASPSEPENAHPINTTGELQLGPSTSSEEPHSTSSVEPPSTSATQGSSTSSVVPLKPAEDTASPTPWFHMEPDITRAVISKAEEELLSSLSALMRNRVENEKLHRQMTTSMQAIDDARKEHVAIKNQIRSAEEELATRVKEHESLRDEVAQTQQKLQTERGKHIEHQEAWFKTRQELDASRRNVQSATSELGETQETGRLMKSQVAELKKELTRLLGERESMLAQLRPIREELDQRLSAREAVIEQVTVLHQHVESLTDEKNTLSKATPEQISERSQLQKELEQAREEFSRLRREADRLRSDHGRLTAAKHDAGAELSDVQGRLTSLRFTHAELLERIYQSQQTHNDLLESVKQASESHHDLLQKIDQTKQTLDVTERPRKETISPVAEPVPTAAVKEPEPPVVAPVAKETAKPEEAHKAEAHTEPVEPELPLFLSHPVPPVAASWDSYVLESEFFTEDNLDAAKVAELVTNLPGIDHSLIVQQFGPMLADRFPQRLHSLFQVPRRDYSLLYDRLPNKVRDYQNLNTRVSTYQIGDDFLTLSGAKDVFLAITHEAPVLRPGVPEKIAIVAEELGKMYPGQADRAVGVA
jgi:predicted  nucleic acid-binding Zn-ribbon protein